MKYHSIRYSSRWIATFVCSIALLTNATAQTAASSLSTPAAPVSTTNAKTTAAGSATSSASTPTTAASAASVQAKNPLLVVGIVTPIVNAIGTSGGDAIGNLYKKLLSFFGSDPKPAPSTETSDKANKDSKAPASTVATAADTKAEAPALTAAIAYTLEQLDPKTFTVINTLDMTQNAAKLHTGDTFAIKIASNLPGQIRVDNIDSAGTVNPLGTYNVLPGRDNRIPRSKGIRLVGVTGLETFKAYFTPCIPPEATAIKEMEAYKGKLSACEPTASKLALASKGSIRSKSAANLDMPDTSVAVSAVPGIKDGDVISHEFSLDHSAPK